MAGGALAALGGVFFGLASRSAGTSAPASCCSIFAGVTLGGLGTAYGALVGCLVIGLVIQWSTLFLARRAEEPEPAGVLIPSILLIRPQGILGRAGGRLLAAVDWAFIVERLFSDAVSAEAAAFAVAAIGLNIHFGYTGR